MGGCGAAPLRILRWLTLRGRSWCFEYRATASDEPPVSARPGRIVEGSWGMAAAVFDASEQARYALSVTRIESRFRAEPRRRLFP